MANEVKVMIENFIRNSKQQEILVEDIFDEYEDFDPERNRIDVLMALRMLEQEKLGVLAVGRRGKKTRFIKGAIRVKSNIDENKLNNLKEVIGSMIDNQILLLEEDGNLTIDTVQVYTGDKRTTTIDYLKTLEEEGLGTFIIGRRGGMSRFIKGAAKNSAKNKTFVIAAPIEQVQKTFNIINDVIFQHENGKYQTISEILEATGFIYDQEKIQIIQTDLDKLGYYSIK
ncbi:MAG: hypothetical protein ACOYLO_00550 [Ferruginibacter sp.]